MTEKAGKLVKNFFRGVKRGVKRDLDWLRDVTTMPWNILEDVGRFTAAGIKCIAKGNTREVKGLFAEKIAANLDALFPVGENYFKSKILKNHEGYKEKGFKANPLARSLGRLTESARAPSYLIKGGRRG